MRLTEEQFKLLKSWQVREPVEKKQSKYKNKKIITDGIVFDSKKESERYIELKLLERAGEIKDLELQKVFELQPGFKKNGNTYIRITYVADFYYYDIRNNKYVVEDVKGIRTEVYKIKKKLFEYKYMDFELKIIK